MLFSNILFFATAALAAPAVMAPAPVEARHIETRQNRATVGTTVLQIAYTLESNVNYNIGEINKAIVAIRTNTEASIVVALQATIKSNFAAIAKAFQDATAGIVAATGGSLSAIINLATGLSQDQVNQLVEAINVVKRVLNNVRIIITLTVTNLGPDIVAFFNAEVTAVKNALGPFLQPLVTFLTAVRNLSASLTVTVQGLSAGLGDLTATIQNIGSSLGLSNLLAPILNSVGGLLGLIGVKPT